MVRQSNSNPTRKPAAAERVWAAEVVRALTSLYPDAHCELQFTNPFQLLIAVILSAQCTDKTVNKVTPELFARFPDAASLAAAEASELESIIKPTGFFRNKAKAIRSAASDIVTRFGGRVPETLDELIQLHGVGRKTANVVLGECFGTPGVVTDTHVLRLSKRIGLAATQDPEKLERELMALIDRDEWTMFSHRLIWHGRRVCNARKPECRRCGLATLCKFPDKTVEA